MLENVKIFQSTPPARGATATVVPYFAAIRISIHAPREGGDPIQGPFFSFVELFQSTPPARGATEDGAGVITGN